ncbi:MAG: 6-phosphogluconolactonase [Candidatus Anoxychlamydiales bacterium]|nr:6-phosphogluconolactonase [Candidatus Anoxychlamydiales bacterium]
MRTIKMFDDLEEMNFYLIDLFTQITFEAVEKNNKAYIALSGGSTPLSFYQNLSKQKHLDWDKIHIFFVDERMVSNLDEKSNIYKIEKHLTKPLNLKKENVHYISKDIDILDAIKEYELDIKSFLHVEKPSFDLILLGIGEDGHTASLFPNSGTLKEEEKLIVLASKKDEDFDRVSFSYPLINLAKNVIFLSLGENKASIIKKILLDKDRSLPAFHVKAQDNLFYILDRKAAKFIDL